MNANAARETVFASMKSIEATRLEFRLFCEFVAPESSYHLIARVLKRKIPLNPGQEDLKRFNPVYLSMGR